MHIIIIQCIIRTRCSVSLRGNNPERSEKRHTELSERTEEYTICLCSNYDFRDSISAIEKRNHNPGKQAVILSNCTIIADEMDFREEEA